MPNQYPNTDVWRLGPLSCLEDFGAQTDASTLLGGRKGRLKIYIRGVLVAPDVAVC